MASGGQPFPSSRPPEGFPHILSQRSIANSEQLRETHTPRDENGRIGSAMAGSGSDAGLIELTVEKPQHLFHAFDPSPLAGRELDEKVERFIIHTAEDNPAPEYRLIVHVPGEGIEQDVADGLSGAIRAHFNHLGESVSRKRRSLMREGRQYLAVGIAFLFVCGVAGYFALRALPPPIGLFVDQGLLIVGWVANWRPIEIFLYDWRPLWRNQKLFAALGRMEIGFRPFQAAGSTQGTGE